MVQLDIFNSQEKRDKLERLEYAVDGLRERFGYHIIQRGILYVDRKLTGINPKEHTIHPVSFFDSAIKTDYHIKAS